MKKLLLICSVLLFIALADLPIGYYTLLRIVVTIGAIAVVVSEYKYGFNFWPFAFGLTAILFNPLIPIYLNNKEAWIPIDIGAGILFLIKSVTNKSRKDE